MLIQQHIKSIILTIIIAISLYLGSVIYLGWNDSVQLVKQITLSGWLGLISCSLTSYALRYLRWNYYITKLEYSIPHRQHILYYLSAFALTITPAKVGETIRSLYLYNHGVSYSKSIAAFFTERLLDLMVVTSLSSMLLFQHSDYNFFIILLSLFILLIIILIKSNYLPKISHFFCDKFHSKKIKSLLDSLISLSSHAKTLLQIKSLSIGAVLGVIAWTIQGTAFYILLNQLGFTIPIHIAISIYSIAIIAGAVSFIPGGIGSTEIVMGVFLYSFGAPKEIVVIAPIIIRMTSLWFAVAIGLISTVLITKNIYHKET